jgi:hypothetical protein
MTRTHSFVVSFCAAFVFALPSATFASSLTPVQVSAIVGLLQAFNVDQATLATVQAILAGSSGTQSASTTPTAPPPVAVHVPTSGNVYTAGVGYDLSYNTSAYPTIPFSFAIVGVTGGRAFIHNARINSEYPWANFGSVVRPTVYMNLNAPYGSTVAGHITSPKICPPDSLNSGTGISTEPTACDGYNYGYNAAQDAYMYATANKVSSAIWWLDIEEANSWSNDTNVNDATIQGATDFLNSKNLRVGMYSVPYMWRNIAGSDFVPAQTINGAAATTPTWLPIGTATQVTVINTCSGGTSFISGSPIWLVQYEANTTAIDQNVACG